jgi:hypothetical protein
MKLSTLPVVSELEHINPVDFPASSENRIASVVGPGASGTVPAYRETKRHFSTSRSVRPNTLSP